MNPRVYKQPGWTIYKQARWNGECINNFGEVNVNKQAGWKLGFVNNHEGAQNS